MLQDFITIVQSNIPISTAAPTHYVRFPTHTFPILFPNFFNLLGPFVGLQRLLPSILEFPFSRYVSPYFSDVSTSFLTSFFTVVLKGLTAGSKVHV